MKRKILFSVLLLSTSLTGFCTIWTVSDSGHTFTPATITITVGDTVNFNLTSDHNAREVSMSTWNANGTNALPGGFQVPFGGGMVLPAQLGVGTHYYVCSAHASFGMKGIIIVQASSGTGDINQRQPNISVYPNPSYGNFQFLIDGLQITKNSKMEIYNVQGQKIYQAQITNTKTDIDLSNHPKTIYFVRFYSGQTSLSKKIFIQ